MDAKLEERDAQVEAAPSTLQLEVQTEDGDPPEDGHAVARAEKSEKLKAEEDGRSALLPACLPVGTSHRCPRYGALPRRSVSARSTTGGLPRRRQQTRVIYFDQATDVNISSQLLRGLGKRWAWGGGTRARRVEREVGYDHGERVGFVFVDGFVFVGFSFDGCEHRRVGGHRAGQGDVGGGGRLVHVVRRRCVPQSAVVLRLHQRAHSGGHGTLQPLDLLDRSRPYSPLIASQCGVGSSGECISTSNSKGATLYTSDDYVYCSDDDDKCAACEHAWVTQYQTLGEVLSSSCTGDGGCICLAVCERPTRVNIVVHEQCPVFGGTATRILAFMGIGIGVCLFFAFIAFTTRWFISFCAPGTCGH